ncbi:MAG: hypothetical protein ACYTEP_05790 [Planctomycetota bacterium]
MVSEEDALAMQDFSFAHPKIATVDVVSLDLPGCKSASQRALILAALAEGESKLYGLSDGDDTRFLRTALEDLGWEVRAEMDGLCVVGRNGPQVASVDRISLGEGGSTLRFLVPVLAATENRLELETAPGLRARPHGTLKEVLEAMGARLEDTGSGFLLESSGELAQGPLAVPVDLSSQFFSGFLMAAGAQAQEWVLEREPVSMGYLQMTVEMLRRFRGADCLETTPCLWRQQAGFGKGMDLEIPADTSALVFFAVAAILLRRVIGISRDWDERHPDQAVLDFLRDCSLLTVEGQVLTPIPDEISGTPVETPVFNLQDSPDSGPALAVLAAMLPGGIRFRNPERLRIKESDRIDGMRRLAELCGGSMEEHADGIWIHHEVGVPPAAPFDPTADHRLAMAAGIATLRYPQLEILDRDCVDKSFPRFWEMLARLS